MLSILNQSSDQIASLLVQHGIKDITNELEFERCSSKPFAHGGFGSIYRGELRDGTHVAIKCIGMREDLELRGNTAKYVAVTKFGPLRLRLKLLSQRATHELYTWSKCNHPGVLNSLGFALSEGYILLVSPFMKNGSLTDYLKSNNFCDRLKLCIDLAIIVECLHGKGIVHGDIKADNILVSDSGDPQLVDFGNATLVNYLTLCFTRTSPELGCSVRFTANVYKAPEILLEISETHTIESDIFSLGMTILQILTRELPYAGKPDPVAIAKIVGGILPPRPMVDDILQNRRAKDYLWDLLLRCWDHNPNHRPTATEVKQTLVAIQRGSNVSSKVLDFRFRITPRHNWLRLGIYSRVSPTVIKLMDSVIIF